MPPPFWRITTRPPRGPAAPLEMRTGADDLQPFLEDAAHYSGGHARAVVFPRTERDVAEALGAFECILPVGAQSSLTGGATPRGGVVLSTARMASILTMDHSSVRVQAGVPLAALQEALAARSLYYPPAPTFNGACAGGVVATNAAGAATFKYGSTRDWVEAITVVLASGDVLDVERGAVRAHPDRYFEIETTAGVSRVPVPTYRMPDVAKRSAGYFAAPGMDLIDLFIGSEGTLGIVTEITFRLVSPAPTRCLALVRLSSEERALKLVQACRDASQATWRSRDPAGIDVAAIEHMDRRCLDVLREDGIDRKHGVDLPHDAAIALLIQLELAADVTSERAFEEIAAAQTANAPDTRLGRLCRLFAAEGVLDTTELALPGDLRRADQLFAIREAVPAGVNQRVAQAKRSADPRIEKTAADMIVPFSRFPEMMRRYREGFERRGLDYAVWGHISDGNVHPNVIPRSMDDMRAGREAILEFGDAVARLGGCPLAEHGVGRSPVKQQLLRQLYGERGIDEMRAVKRALDPGWKLAPGVLFE